MTTRKLATLLFVLAAAVGMSHAGWFQMALNDKTLDLEGGFHIGKDPSSRMALGGRYIYEDDNETSIGAFIGGISIGETSVEGLELLLAGQYYFGEGGNEDASALGLGVDANWAPGNMKGVFFGGRFFYAPSLFAWGDTEGFSDFAVRAGYRITPKVDVFVSYHKIKAEFEAIGDVTLSDGWLIGFGGRF